MNKDEKDSNGGDYSPWIAVKLSLATHHKTSKLKGLLSLQSRHEAMGLVVDLFIKTWANPWRDGDWTKWGSDCLEDMLGWIGDRGALVRALQEAGFLDGLRVHDWVGPQSRQIRDRLRYRREDPVPPPPRNGKPAGVDDSAQVRKRTQQIIERDK